MKHVKIERPASPRRLPPRWLVSPHYWPAIELEENQIAYEVTRSFEDAAGQVAPVAAWPSSETVGENRHSLSVSPGE